MLCLLHRGGPHPACFLLFPCIQCWGQTPSKPCPQNALCCNCRGCDIFMKPLTPCPGGPENLPICLSTAVTLPAGSRCLTGSNCHSQLLEQTKHPFHVSASFLGVWNFVQPQEHPGLHRLQPSGIPPRTGTGLRLGVGRVSTSSVDVQCVDLPPTSNQSTAVSLCLWRTPKPTYFAQYVQDTEPGRQVKLCAEECAGALGALPLVDTNGITGWRSHLRSSNPAVNPELPRPPINHVPSATATHLHGRRICRMQRGSDPELGFACDIGVSWRRQGEGRGASGAVCLGKMNVQKDCLLEGDGKSLAIGPKESPLALVHLHHVQGKHQRSQGSLEP